ncbi:hypothetical protein M404DRAFT_142467 [Pisolithus tinctorius Marx 270]|uniref:Heterokaryon incompatibility domain-containing protein n=1 Tax=Pisolithus tinctorius Marx 270 TaxID=870435 RepID=A0A0C3PAC4_PISTI|nr:hypothetical protein M404DRAFT_142467 [Pisolithus tinctorius Marx 270]
MHLASNLANLLTSLWCGTMECGLDDDKDQWMWAVLADDDAWQEHGEDVQRSSLYLPGSYDRKPRNIAEKINTQYKTWEFQLYLFGLAPILLYDVLPEKYWTNHCKLVRGFQIMCQTSITHEELVDTHALLCSWEYEFEHIYYGLRKSRLHFIRPCVHQVVHLVTEALYKGPPASYAQWTMERIIGNLGQQIRQPSKPFVNISREGVRRCQVNSLLSAMPELDDSVQTLPQGSVELGDGYVLLQKRAKYPIIPKGHEADAISQFLGPTHKLPHIKKWACLCLPNGQIARSAWRECLRPPECVRVSRNVKFTDNGEIRCGEVCYFTRLAVSNPAARDNERHFKFIDVAVIQMYSRLDARLLELSSQVLAASTKLEEIKVIPVKNITGVIAMIPRHIRMDFDNEQLCHCMMERPGYNISKLGMSYREDENGVGDDDDGNDVDVD